MTGRQFSSLILTVILVSVTLIGCGVKSNPRGPEYVIIPPVTDLQAYAGTDEVLLFWTPRLEYSNGEDIEYKSIEIYSLSEELSDEFEDLLESDRKRVEEAERSGRELGATFGAADSLGETVAKIYELERIRVDDFDGRASLHAVIPVEDMAGLAVYGRMTWQGPHGITMSSDLPDGRTVLAIRIVDADGNKSAFSNLVRIYPVHGTVAPPEVLGSLNENSTTIAWSSLQPSSPLFNELPLAGYNVYRHNENATVRFPLNVEIIPSASPVDWTIQNCAGYGKLEDGFQLVSGGEEPASLSQQLVETTNIADYLQRTLTATVTLKSVGGKAEVRAALDFARAAVGTDIRPANAEIFKDNENPLIISREITATPEFQTVRFSAEVPVDAVAAQISIVFPAVEGFRVPLIVQSVSVVDETTGEELVSNGSFSTLESLSFEDTSAEYGVTNTYTVTGLYKINDYYLETAPSAPVELTLVDTFAPPVPENTAALASAGTVSITWNAVTADDLRGYIIYRSELPGGSWQRLNPEPVTGTIFRDTEAEPGTQYAYKVESVDHAGNESDGGSAVTVTTLSAN